MNQGLTHFDARGASRMVDVSAKATTRRVALAKGRVTMAAETMRRILDRDFQKGDVLAVARLAGIMAAKKTGELIPLCHPLGLAACTIDFEPVGATTIEVSAECVVDAQTGVEMEAMTAVAVACLTIYDMCKAVDRGMSIEAVRLVKKTGGKSGDWLREPATASEA